MAHATRGYRSAAYEILKLVDVDYDELSITIQHAGAYEPQTYRITANNTRAARQLVAAAAASIKVSPTADALSGWESAVTLLNAVTYSAVLLEQLRMRGIDDFSDERLTIPVLRSLYDPLTQNTKRSAVHLLARILRDVHPSGKALSTALKNTRFPVDETNPFTYDDETADAIETAAKGAWGLHYAAVRDLFGRMGYDVREHRGRGWLRISAQQVIDDYTRRYPKWAEAAASQPLDGDFDHEVAWALTHPSSFGVVRGTPVRIIRPSLKSLGRLLYPDRSVLTAALILHCLGETSGYNYAVLMEKSADSLLHIGRDTALETSVKARNHSQDTRPTSTASIYAPGGIIETLTGLTRFSRHSRRHLTDNGKPLPIVDRLYVEHHADPTQSKVLSNAHLHNGWRSDTLGRHWPLDTDHSQVSLQFRALRLVAQRRALKEGLRADVHGHTDRTKVHYLAHVLPKHVFNKHAVAAQEAFHEANVAAFQVPTQDDPNAASAELAAVPRHHVVDVEIGLCTSGGNDPDDSTKPCALGITACFLCPNGYRTVEHVPGLLAAVELTRIIEENNVQEWQTGDAAALRFYAQASLDAFPPLVVSNVQRSVDLTPHVQTVTGMYLELRHG